MTRENRNDPWPFASRSRSRVISAHSWYLTSFVYPLFHRSTFCPATFTLQTPKIISLTRIPSVWTRSVHFKRRNHLILSLRPTTIRYETVFAFSSPANLSPCVTPPCFVLASPCCFLFNVPLTTHTVSRIRCGFGKDLYLLSPLACTSFAFIV